MKLGAHVSIKGGVENSPIYGNLATCEVLQIFSKNQMQWKIPKLSKDSIFLFKERLKSFKVEAVSIHASYLLNLAAISEDIREKSINDLSKELERADMLGIPYVVFHPGAHLGSGEIEGIKRIVQSINEIFDKSNSKRSLLLIETTAGEGTTLGYKFEHIRDIFDGVKNHDRLGVCFDTCHVFASGYDIRTGEDFIKVLEDFDRIVGLEYLKLFHLNDSKRDLGSRIDRHEEIGKGKIGIEAFRFLVNHPRFGDISGILEIPGDIEGYKRNLEVLRRLRNGNDL